MSPVSWSLKLYHILSPYFLSDLIGNRDTEIINKKRNREITRSSGGFITPHQEYFFFDKNRKPWRKQISHLYGYVRSGIPDKMVISYHSVFLVPLCSVPEFRSVRSLFLPCGMFHLFVSIVHRVWCLVYLYFRSIRNISRYSSVPQTWHVSFSRGVRPCLSTPDRDPMTCPPL